MTLKLDIVNMVIKSLGRIVGLIAKVKLFHVMNGFVILARI